MLGTRARSATVKVMPRDQCLIVISERDHRQSADWMEKVGDQQYQK
jgi:hypothetical protein